MSSNIARCWGKSGHRNLCEVANQAEISCDLCAVNLCAITRTTSLDSIDLPLKYHLEAAPYVRVFTPTPKLPLSLSQDSSSRVGLLGSASRGEGSQPSCAGDLSRQNPFPTHRVPSFSDRVGDLAQVLDAADKGETGRLLALLQGACIGKNSPEVSSHMSFEQLRSEALLRAARNGHVEALRQLVTKCHANVDHKSADGWTATMYAARYGHTSATVALVKECHATADKANKLGRTALMYAASCGHVDTALALATECGADPLRKDLLGWNAIMYASAAGLAGLAQELQDFQVKVAHAPRRIASS